MTRLFQLFLAFVSFFVVVGCGSVTKTYRVPGAGGEDAYYHQETRGAFSVTDTTIDNRPKMSKDECDLAYKQGKINSVQAYHSCPQGWGPMGGVGYSPYGVNVPPGMFAGTQFVGGAPAPSVQAAPPASAPSGGSYASKDDVDLVAKAVAEERRQRLEAEEAAKRKKK